MCLSLPPSNSFNFHSIHDKTEVIKYSCIIYPEINTEKHRIELILDKGKIKLFRMAYHSPIQFWLKWLKLALGRGGVKIFSKKVSFFFFSRVLSDFDE